MKRVFFVIFIIIFSVSFLCGSDILHVLNEDLRWLIEECADGYNIPTEYLIRQMFLESSFDENAVCFESNGSQSIGLFQLNSNFFDYFEERFYEWESIDGDFDPYNKYHNVQVACAYIEHLYNQFDGNWIEVFIAFNAGPTRVRRGDYPDCSMDYAQFIVYGDDVYGYYDRRIEEFNRLVLDNSY